MHYKDTQNKLHVIDSSEFAYLLPVGSVPITDEEAEAIRIANIPVPVPPTKAELLKKVDADVDLIYAAAIGNRATEYSEAELQANAFKAALYTGAVPSFVASWLTNNTKGLTTAQEATDDIIAQANAWRGAASAIRANRLTAKKNITNDVSTAMQQWGGFVTAIRASLGI
jgi:hypothetical protein